MNKPTETDRSEKPAVRGSGPRQTRQEREAAALRANLQKRKARQRRLDKPADSPTPS
ncbi:MAG TPA: hypothetical protein VIG49_04880 [Acetobacteraceae bacterium]|jgi:hypothetical protein